MLELNASGAVINRFDRGIRGQLIRSQHHGWYLHDARGSVVQRVNAQGVVLRNYRYTAFGSEVSPDSSNTNPFRFNGEYWDAHRGEYYLRARSFNPRTGRFTQPDPFWGIHNMQDCIWSITQAGNLYMFVMHNPVMFHDPWGLLAELTNFVLYDPNTHPFSINSHVTQIGTALHGLFGGSVEWIQTLGWTAESFIQWWNSLTGDIGAIVFFGHTSWDRIQFDSNNDVGRRYFGTGRDPAYDFGISISQMQGLNTISLNMMLIMGCWSADMNRANTISMEFARHINRGGTVFGIDGYGRDLPAIGISGRSRILDGSQYFIAHIYRDGVVNRHNAVHAPSFARPGVHVRLMHSWHVSYHWLTNPYRHLYQ